MENLPPKTSLSETRSTLPPDRSLLIVDDDEPLRLRLGRAMEKRGFDPVLAGSVSEALAILERQVPAFAVVDLKLDDGDGLQLVNNIHDRREDCRAIILTGYGNITTAVAAIKAGAIDYLPKPADADDVEKALLAGEGELPSPPENPMSADRVRWEHIQRVYELCGQNVSETARRLGMHRRTLQRILAKRAPN